MGEKELIEKCLKGDEEACAALVAQNREAVYLHCLHVVHDEEIAEDLTQETFLHAFRHLGSFKMRARFSTWVWRIAHNLCLSHLKKQHLHFEEFNEEILPPKFLEKEEVHEEEVARIREVMQNLDPKHRLVFEMYDLEHIPQKEIAERLGIPHGTVRSRLYYARKVIRRALEEA